MAGVPSGDRSSRAPVAACAIAAVAVAVAWWIRWGTDDAYIAFVYAKAFVHGDGLAWFGTRIEGYTDFAWVLWSALGLALGADPLVWAWIASLVGLAATILVTYQIAALRATPRVGVTAAAALATSYTVLAYGTSGLETMVQTALLAGAWLQVERLMQESPSVRRAAGLSLLAALAMWTRLDSAPILAVLGAVLAHRLVRVRAPLPIWIAAIGPALVLVGGWLGWKLVYYGQLLPNTFYAKTGTIGPAHGLAFAWAFARAYCVWPFMLGAAVYAIARRRLGLPLAIFAAHVGYVIAIGGDFMEFRFFVPAWPAFAVLAASLVLEIAPALPIGPRLRAFAVIAVLGAFSLHHRLTFWVAADHSYDSIWQMASYYGKIRDNHWTELGASLRTLVGTRASTACNGAGAIAYNSDLPMVDQLGLNDAWVAREGARPPADYPRPGHQRFATYDYLVRRGVTFVIGSPTLIPRGGLHNRRDRGTVGLWFDALLGPTRAPSGKIEVFGAPVGDDAELLMLYLTPDPEVAARVADWDHVTLRIPDRPPPPN